MIRMEYETLSERMIEIHRVVKDMKHTIEELKFEIEELKCEKSKHKNEDISYNLGEMIRGSYKPIYKSNICLTRPQVIRLAKDAISKALDRMVDNYTNISFQVDQDNGKVYVFKQEKMRFKNGKTVWNTTECKMASCLPEDDFNSEIGKIIALYKLMDYRIPDYFLNAPNIGEQYIK